MELIYILLLPYSSSSIFITLFFSLMSRKFPYRTLPIQFQSFSLPYVIIFGIINKFLLNIIFSFGTLFSLFHTATITGFSFLIIDSISLIGITGQICSGKTTLSTYLKSKYNASIINIEEINREILLREDVKNEIEKIIGKEYFWYNSETKRKEIDKQKMKEVKFNDYKKSRQLERIMYSRVIIKFFQILIMEKLIKRTRYVFVQDTALLRFAILRVFCQSIICVCVRNQEILIERIMNRDKCDEKEARNEIRNQMWVDKFEKMSNIVIYNDDIGIDELNNKVDGVMNSLFPLDFDNIHHHYQNRYEHFHHE